MAHSPGTQARSQRLITAAATVSLAVATGFAIGRVFAGAVSSYKLILVAVVSALVASALERRNLLLATLLSAVALVVVVGWFVAPHTLRFAIPTARTLHAIVAASRLVGEQARIQVAPSQPTAPLMLAAITATWAAVFSAHALAFRAGSPLLALLPPLALVAFADTVLDQFVKPVYGLVFLAAALFVIFADGLRRLQAWGPVWTGPGREARLTSTAGRGARRVIAGALGVALVSPALIPGFGSKAILALPSHNVASVRIDPFVNIASSLQQSAPERVFTVTTPTPTYYRFEVLPNFDGASGWTPDANPQTLPLTSATLNLNPDIDPRGTASATPVTERFHFTTELENHLLPYGYPARSIDVGHPIEWDPATGVADYGEPVAANTSYSVVSLVMHPSAAQLEALPRAAADARYTAIPADLDPRIAHLARTWTADATSTFDEVMAIQAHLRSSAFTYSTKVPERNSQTALADFLFNDRRGFCEQFAGAMAVLLRTLGIPTRVAVGFDAGAEVNAATDTWTISNKDAHAWPEVLFPGYGWLQFEPTPAKTFLTAETYLQTPGGKGGFVPGGQGSKGGEHGGGDFRKRRKTGVLNEHAASREGGAAPAQAPARSGWHQGRRLLAWAVLLSSILFLLVPLARAWKRRRRLRRAASAPRRLILATYDVFTERAAELGFPRDPGETLEEYRRRVLASGLLRHGDLDRLTDITVSAAYARREPERADASAAEEAAARTLTDLRKGTPLLQRVRGLYVTRR